MKKILLAALLLSSTIAHATGKWEIKKYPPDVNGITMINVEPVEQLGTVILSCAKSESQKELMLFFASPEDFGVEGGDVTLIAMVDELDLITFEDGRMMFPDQAVMGIQGFESRMVVKLLGQMMRGKSINVLYAGVTSKEITQSEDYPHSNSDLDGWAPLATEVMKECGLLPPKDG